MEEEKNEYIDSDINAIMTRFSNFRMRYFEDRKRLRENEGVVLAQREQLRLCREAEENEKRKAAEFQRALKQQQDIVDNFLGVNEENVRLTAQVKQLKREMEELIAKMQENNETWQRSKENQIQAHKKEVEDLKAFSDRKAREASADLDMYRAEYDMKRKEMETKFQALQKEKRAELELTSRICESKLRDMEDHFNTTIYNHEQQRKDNAAAITMYKQKLADSERKLMQAEIEARRKVAQAGFRYNNNSTLPAQPATILKKGTPRATNTWRPEDSVRGGGKTNNNNNNTYPGPGVKGKGGGSNIQPLDFVEEEAAKKVSFAAPKRRKLYNPNDDDIF